MSSDVCAVLTSPEPSAEPISLSRLVNDAEVDEELLDVLLDEELFDVLLDGELDESSRLVTLSYAVCALLRSPELMALKRLSISCVRTLPVESLLLPLVDDVSVVELADVVLGVA